MSIAAQLLFEGLLEDLDAFCNGSGQATVSGRWFDRNRFLFAT